LKGAGFETRNLNFNQINLDCLSQRISKTSHGGTCLKQVVWFVCVRTNPDFSVDVSCQIKGNEVSFNFVSKIRWNKTRLIGNITADKVQVQVHVLVLPK
jgi:hypothetical protein